MATVYVDSTATGSNNGTSWANAYTAIESAIGNSDIWVSKNHNQTSVSGSALNFGGSRAAPIRVLCLDPADDSLSTGAVVKFGTGNGDLRGYVWARGIKWTAPWMTQINGTAGDDGFAYFESCTFECTYAGTATNVGLQSGNTYYGPGTHFRSCTFDHSSRGAYTEYGLNLLGPAIVENCTWSLGSITLDAYFRGVVDGQNNHTVVRDCDLSTVAALYGSMTSGQMAFIDVHRCKVHASYTLPTLNHWSQRMRLMHCYAGTITDPASLLTHDHQYAGDVTLAPSTIYRSSGASDGTTAHAWKMATNANALELYSWLESPPIVMWVDADASPSGATGKGLFQTTRMSPRGTPAALTTDSGSTWNGSGVGTKQKVSVTIGDYTLTVYLAGGATMNDDDFWVEVHAPDQVGGPVTVRCFLAKPSTTVYVDPKLDIA